MLELQIPRLPEWSGKLSFDFHTIDNAPFSSSLWIRGDHAPNRRFNYRYQPQD